MQESPAAAFAAIIVLLASTTLVSATASAAGPPEATFRGVEPGEVQRLLSEQCIARGLAVMGAGPRSVICGAGVRGDEPFLAELASREPDARFHQQVLQFALSTADGGVRVQASPWVEVLGPGGDVRREDVTSANHLFALQTMLNDLSATAAPAGAGAPPGPWDEHYGSEDEWRLDAHRRAVAGCDQRLAELDRGYLDRHIEAAGLRPFSSDLRGRCEELYEAVYLWGLARGMQQPTPEQYVDYLLGRE